MQPTELIAFYKTFYLRGYTYFSIINTIILMGVGLKVFYEPIANLGIPMLFLYIGALLAVIVIPAIIGLFDYKYISHYEYKLSWRQTRDAYEMNKQINELHAKFIGDKQEIQK